MKDTALFNEIDWHSIKETTDIINKLFNLSITDSQLYRLTMNNKITPSIHFQSPIMLHKLPEIPCDTMSQELDHPKSLILKLCYTTPTELKINKIGNQILPGNSNGFITPSTYIMDTPLTGNERAAFQRLLAKALNMPEPIIGFTPIQSGIILHGNDGETYQACEHTTIKKRIVCQMQHLDAVYHNPNKIIKRVIKLIDNPTTQIKYFLNQKRYFPLFQLPRDACFVYRSKNIMKFSCTCMHNDNNLCGNSKIRISSPAALLFWLACINNSLIGPELIKHPYKLLSLFEVWAREAGITDKLSGDTLKKLLERGKPK